MNPKDRIKELVETLNRANVEYYLNDNPTLKKFLSIKKIQNKLNILKEKLGENNNIKENKKIEPGAISYGLPVEAINDRKIENEVKARSLVIIGFIVGIVTAFLWQIGVPFVVCLPSFFMAAIVAMHGK